MACRIKVKIRADDKEVEGKALLNSGFESDSPDIVVPVDVAEALGLWPPRTSKTAALDTGGGEVVNPYYISCADLHLILGDREPKTIRVNIIVNPHVDEIVISDYVAGALGIMLLDFKRGFWRLSDDPQDVIRRSE